MHIYQNIIKPLGKLYIYATTFASLLLLCHVYHPKINHHMKRTMCNELLSTQLLLRCEKAWFNCIGLC